MFGWKENNNGNYTRIHQDFVMTVYKNKDTEAWKGVYRGHLLLTSYDSPEEAQEAMDRFAEGESNLVMDMNAAGRSKKDGSYYKRTRQGIFKVKQARSGKWYITIDGRILSNLWLDTEEEGIKKVIEMCSLND